MVLFLVSNVIAGAWGAVGVLLCRTRWGAAPGSSGYIVRTTGRIELRGEKTTGERKIFSRRAAGYGDGMKGIEKVGRREKQRARPQRAGLGDRSEIDQGTISL
jgi:hypothetical protein